MEPTPEQLEYLNRLDKAMDLAADAMELALPEFRTIAAYFGVTYAPEEEKQMQRLFQAGMNIGMEIGRKE